jgi:hypothetical protein
MSDDLKARLEHNAKVLRDKGMPRTAESLDQTRVEIARLERERDSLHEALQSKTSLLQQRSREDEAAEAERDRLRADNERLMRERDAFVAGSSRQVRTTWDYHQKLEAAEAERDRLRADNERLRGAVRSAMDAWEAGEFDEAKYYELRHVLDNTALATDHPQETHHLTQGEQRVMQDALRSSGTFRAKGVRTDQSTHNDQSRFERVQQQVVYSVADFFNLEMTDAQARSIAREVLQAADQPGQAGERPQCTHTRLTKDRCPICGPLDDDARPTGEPPDKRGAHNDAQRRIQDALKQAKARLERGWPDAALREIDRALAKQDTDQ